MANFFNLYFLNEVTADEKYNKQYTGKLDRKLFDKAVELDPTSKGTEKVGQYVDWIIRNKIFDIDVDKLHDLLNKYTKLKGKLEPNKRDINRISFPELESIIKDLESKGVATKSQKADERKIKAEKESKVSYEDDELKVINPLTMYASQYFGANSNWCTARQDNTMNLFDRYNRKGKLYIIIDKKTNKKWQLFLNDDKDQHEYRDSSNSNFDPMSTFSGNDEFLEWMKKEGFPEARDYLTDDEIDDLADDLLSYLRVTKSTPNINIANDIIHSAESNFRDSGEQITANEIISYIRNEINDYNSNYDNIIKKLEARNIDTENDEMQGLALLYCNWVDMSEDEFQERIIDDHEDDLVYIFTDDINNIVFNKFDDNHLTDDNWEFIEDWLHWFYNHTDEYKYFYDGFLKALEKNKISIDDKEKEHLKNLIDKVEKIEYKKQKHPELKLDNFRMKAQRYL